MTSENLIDPELKPLLAASPKQTLSRAKLPDIRAAFQASLSEAPSPPTGRTHVESHTVLGPVGAPLVRVLSYRPDGASGTLPGLITIHGGGYVLGTPEMMDAANRLLASELGCLILSVDYRLAPETQFPGPLEDCYTVLVWMQTNAERLGIDTARIGVKGESAGGGLAAALALLTRDRSGPPLAFQQLIYPMIDDRTCIDPDPNPFTGEFVWTRENNSFGWSALLGKPPGSPDVPSYAAAARAESLAGLPPTFISVGALDLFLEESLAYAGRLSRAGVPVELHVYPGAFHTFLKAQEASVAQAAERDSRESLRHFMHT